MTEELRIELSATLDQFNQQMDGALSKVKEVGQKMKAVGKSLSTNITLPLAAAGGVAVNSAVKFEKLETSLAVLTGSAENGARAFERLKGFSANTPFQLADLVSVNNQLLGFGMNVDQAFNSLQMLGDVAAVSGADLSRVAVAFGQSAAAGRVMTQDLNQFINNGIPIYQILGDVTGKNVGELRDLASQGGITFDMLEAGFKKATSEGGTFFQGTAKLSQTLGGRLSTLRDNVDIMAASFGQVIGQGLDPLISATQKAANYFGQLDEGAKKVIVGLAAFAAAAGPMLFLAGTVIPAMVTGFTLLTGPIGLVVAALGVLAASVLYIWDNWAAIKERLSDISWWRNALLEMAAFVVENNPLQLLLAPLHYIANQLGVELQNPFNQTAEAIRAMKVETKDYANEFGSFTDAIKHGAKAALTSLTELDAKKKSIGGSDSLNNGGGATTGGGGGATTGGGGGATTGGGGGATTGGGGGSHSPIPIANEGELEEQAELIGLNADELQRFYQNSDKAFNKMQLRQENLDYLDQMQERLVVLRENAGLLANTLGQGLTNAFSQMISGADEPFKAFGQLLKDMITRLIAAAVAAFALSTILSAIMPGAGGGLSFGTLFQSFSGGFQIPEFANGGIVSGPTLGLMGEYAGARSNPEVIAPLSKLQGMLAGSNMGGGQLVSKVSGEDLLLVQERAQNRRTRRRGF